MKSFLTLFLIQFKKDYKCWKTVNFIPKHKFVIRKGRIYANSSWLSGVVIFKAGIRNYHKEEAR